MYRSEIIQKAQKYQIQGDEDPIWSEEEWNDYFHDAIDLIAEEVIGADLPYYQVRNVILTRDPLLTIPTYPLPENIRTVKRVQVPTDGSDIYPLRDKIYDMNVFELMNHSIVLTNWNASIPATISINAQTFQPYLGDWDGTDDSTIAFIPMAPLDTQRGGRLIARVMTILAQAKGEDLTSEQASMSTAMINAFVDKIGGNMDETVEQVMGT